MTIEYILTAEDDDVLITEGGTELLAFEVNTEGLDYGLAIDWNGDGEYDASQEADRLLRWSSSRGRSRIYQPSGNGFSPYEIGKLTLTLDNYDGRYDPWNTTGPLYGHIMPGRDVTFKVAIYDADDSVDSHDTYYVFTGTLVDIRVNGHNKTVDLIVEDGWRFLADWHFYRFPFTTASQEIVGEIRYILERNKIFNASAVAYESHYNYKYPFGVAYSTDSGYENIPRHWWWDGTAKSAVEMIVFGSLGRSWVRSDGKFDYEDLTTSTDAAVATFDEDILLDNIYLPMPWENMRSEVVLKGSNNIWYGLWNSLLASLNEPVKIEAGESTEITLPYKYEELSRPYGTRIKDIVFEAHASESTGSDNMTQCIQRSVELGFNNITMEATNTGSTDVYVTSFDVYGEPLDVQDKTWTFESTSFYRDSSFVLDNPWLSVTAVGSTSGYVYDTETTVNDRVRIDLIGNSLLNHLSQARPYPVVQMRGRWAEQFGRELEDKVTLSLPTFGISDDFRINKIEHKTVGGLQDIVTTYYLYPPITPWYSSSDIIPLG